MASLQEQLMRIAAKQVKMKNGRTIQQNLQDAVNYLYDCIQYYIDLHYRTYAPVVYKRRFDEGMKGSLYVEDFVDARVVGNSIVLSIKADENQWAYNITKEHKSNVFLLMNYGWRANRLRAMIGRRIDFFTDFGGLHFIEEGIRDFNQSNQWGVKINTDKIEPRNYIR